MADFGDVDPNTGLTSGRTDFEGTFDPYAPSVMNGQITPQQWAEYQKKRRRDAIFGILSVLGGATALGGVGAALGGGAGTAASATGTSLPSGIGGLPTGMGVGGSAITGGGVTAPLTGAGAAAGGGALAGGAGTGAAGAGGGAGAAGSGIGAMFGGMSPQDWISLILAGAGTVGGAMSNNNTPTSPTSVTTDPNMQALIKTMQGRLTKSEPLYDSILSMANGLMPIQYQKGGGGMP